MEAETSSKTKERKEKETQLPWFSLLKSLSLWHSPLEPFIVFNAAKLIFISEIIRYKILSVFYQMTLKLLSRENTQTHKSMFNHLEFKRRNEVKQGRAIRKRHNPLCSIVWLLQNIIKAETKSHSLHTHTRSACKWENIFKTTGPEKKNRTKMQNKNGNRMNVETRIYEKRKVKNSWYTFSCMFNNFVFEYFH